MSKKSNLVVSQKGFTLVEIMVALVLLGVVMNLAYSMILFGTRNFSAITTQAALHGSVRMASSLIVAEVRNATAVRTTRSQEGLETDNQLHYTPVSPVGTEERLIELDESELRVGDLEIGIDVAFDNIKFHIEDRILEFTIEAVQGRQSYKLTTSVFLHNL